MSRFYRIIDQSLIGRRDEKSICYIYDKRRGWIPDSDHILMGRIMGYDDSEEPGSPYRMGNSDMMSRIEEITEEDANKLIENIKCL